MPSGTIIRAFGNPDKFIGATRRAIGATSAPALPQRDWSADRSVADIDGQFFIIQRVTQIGTDRDFGTEEVIQGFRMEPIGVPAFALGDEERRIRPFEIVVGHCQSRMVQRYADTGRHAQLKTFDFKGSRQGSENLLREDRGVRRVLEFSRQHNELIVLLAPPYPSRESA